MRCMGSPKGENAGCTRVNHFARGLDAIRDSRIACKDGFSGHSLITFGIRGSQQVRFREGFEPGVSRIISRKARRR
jgi:hypothetical protein